MSLLGIDVSSHNALTAESLKGLNFNFVKATEGTDYVNPYHDSQVALSRANGLLVGHYHFLHPGDVNAQVAWFLRNAKIAAGDAVAVDAENEDPDGTGPLPNVWQGYSWSYRAASIASFISKVESATKGRCLWYTNKDWLDNTMKYATASQQVALRNALRWIAFPAKPGLPGIAYSWVIHQYAVVRGFDRNYLPGEWSQFAVGEELAVDVMNPLTKEMWPADKALWSIWYYSIDASAKATAAVAAVKALADANGLDGAAIQKAVEDAVNAALADLKVTLSTTG